VRYAAPVTPAAPGTLEHPNLVDRLRLVGVYGSSTVMAGELSRLCTRAFDDHARLTPKKQGPSSILLPFEPRVAALAVNYHRTSARVLWDLYASDAQRLEPLYADLMAAASRDRRSWASDGARISVLAFAVEQFAAGERQVVGTVKNALIDGARARGLTWTVDADHPDLVFQVRLYDTTIVVSLDLAGRPMHQRGYRRSTGPAPLREDLAAVLVMLSRHAARTEAFVDPMAGSGTLVIEAAEMARARPIWHSGRRPTAANLAPLSQYLTGRQKALFADTRPVLFANEPDSQVVGALENNLETAGVRGDVEVTSADFRSLDPDRILQSAAQRGVERGLVLCNPPYGHRLRQPDLMSLYSDLGAWCRRFRGWRAAFLVASPDFERAFGTRARVSKPLSNGAIRARFLMFDL
jgi:23S rRNA G2445 N2-methylase RlmL